MRVLLPFPPSAADLNCSIFLSRRHQDTDISSSVVVLGSETARQSSFVDTNPQAQALPDETDPSPVGLSDPQYASQKRRMLDTVNRLRATG